MERLPRHIAIIMDGNGRWARRRGLARSEGHRRGMRTARAMIETASDLGIKFLTLYAFSSENWKRPKEEVAFLMELCEATLTQDLPVLIKNNIRLRHIGRLDGLPASLQTCIQNVMRMTATNDKMSLQLAFNYGSRQEIVDAVRFIAGEVKEGRLPIEAIDEATVSGALTTRDIPDPDLFIRTSGEMRISNFLLWQLCYTEMYVTRTPWPDFNKRELIRAIREYQKRQRRFGGIDG